MGALEKKRIHYFFFLLFFLISTTAFSQTEQNRIEEINIYTEHANKLIWHVNLNVKKLKMYQVQLNDWYSQKYAILPAFKFSSNISDSEISQLILTDTVKIDNPFHDYKGSLVLLRKQTLLFSNFCEQLEELEYENDKEGFYQKNMDILFQLDQMADEFVELSYDFSRTCAVSAGREELPPELEKLKSVVSASKNVIFYIRENAPVSVKSSLYNLNVSLVELRTELKPRALKRNANLNLTNGEVETFLTLIEETANQIAFWGEQYLQSNHTNEEMFQILENSIIAFNLFEGKAGCAGTFNEMLSASEDSYLYYTEEPMFFRIKLQDLQETAEVLVTQVVEDTVKIILPEKDTVVVEGIPTFDPLDVNSLDGALPNNIIIMMDVSASMKTTGKLPLLKQSIIHLLNIMRPIDRISLLAYSGKAEVLIAGAGIENRAELLTVLDTLHSSGGTDIEAGVELGYRTAFDSYLMNGNNRIIIATDGAFGIKSSLLDLVKEQENSGIYLSIFHFNDVKSKFSNEKLLLLALQGHGRYCTVANSEEALNELMIEVKKK